MILILTFSLIVLLCFWATNEAIRDEEKINLYKKVVSLEDTLCAAKITTDWLMEIINNHVNENAKKSSEIYNLKDCVTELQNKYDSLIELYFQADKELVRLKYHAKYPTYSYVDGKPEVIKAYDGCPSYRMIISKEPTMMVVEDIKLHKLVFSISTEIGMYSEISMPHLIEQLKLGLDRTILGTVQETTKFSEVASKLNRKYLLDGLSGKRY